MRSNRTITPLIPLVPLVALFAPPSLALAQQTIVSLPFTSTFTAGPRIQDFPAAQDSMDLWALEDFTTTQPWLMGTFSCFGNGFGTPSDLVAVILDGLPPGGREVMRSTPGAGRLVPFNGWGTYSTSFGGQRLEPGSYWVMWIVQGSSPQLLPVMFVQGGDYAAGQGTPNTAYQYNPGLGWAWPEGALRTVLDGLAHTGNPTGINFTITGNPAPACGSTDFNNDGDRGTDADIEAFFSCLAANCCATCPADADFNGDGDAGTDADIEAFFRVLAGGSC